MPDVYIVGTPQPPHLFETIIERLRKNDPTFKVLNFHEQPYNSLFNWYRLSGKSLFTENQFEILSKAISENTVLEYLGLIDVFINNLHSGTHFSDQCMSNLLDGIQKNKSIRYLNFHFNNLEKKHVLLFMKLIESNPNLEFIYFDDTIEFSRNEFDTFLSSLEKNCITTKIEFLNLRSYADLETGNQDDQDKYKELLQDRIQKNIDKKIQIFKGSRIASMIPIELHFIIDKYYQQSFPKYLYH